MPNKLELIQQLQEAASMLNEVVDEKQVNEIKKEKKDKKGNTVEVVSVEDELFPKEGNAKEQYNQKVIDIINQMIEGKATLEDLLQFVRGQKAASKKKAAANESLERVEEAISNAIQVIQEKGISVNKWADAAQKRIEDNPQMGVTSRGKNELERLHQIASLPRDGKGANEVKAEADRESGEASSKAVRAMLKGDKKEQNKQEEIAWNKGLIATDNKGFNFSKWKAPKKEN